MRIDHIREDYTKASLNINEITEHPIDQFKKWLDEAINAKVNEPTSFTLCTTGPDLLPSGRVVLLKSIDQRGFIFYTNYESKKGSNLRKNPNAGLVFFWPELQRQVCIQGKVTKVSQEESDDYFNSRPFESQLGAIASNQSQTIASREVIENKIEELRKTPSEIKRPENWGGFLVKPINIEFWQGRSSRLHDRIQYTLTTNGLWQTCRLSP